MDRNHIRDSTPTRPSVALRKESVDRNNTALASFRACITSLSARRAWIEIRLADMSAAWNRSLSARRAWIEIVEFHLYTSSGVVALRKESVDRNLWWGVRKAVGSLVALRKESVDRNLWWGVRKAVGSVALRKESVDRNMVCASVCFVCVGRSPQGERG